ncbi:MAG: hypothetical protein ACM3PP_03960 [Candidatus Saccharibacteria bacterium]
MLSNYSFQKKPYHFESSTDYFCDIDAISTAESRTIQKKNWPADDVDQLAVIVQLEKLRNALGLNIISLQDYNDQIQQFARDYSKRRNQNVFENTDIHDTFYALLNDVYRQKGVRK